MNIFIHKTKKQTMIERDVKISKLNMNADSNIARECKVKGGVEGE